MSEELHIENRIAMEDNALDLGVRKLGSPSLYTCPDCYGVLIQLHGDGPLRFRCHTGHAFTAESLAAHAADMIEERLWSAVRTMEESLLLLRQIAEQVHAGGNRAAAERLLDRAREVQQQAQMTRQLVLQQALPAAAGSAAVGDGVPP